MTLISHNLERRKNWAKATTFENVRSQDELKELIVSIQEFFEKNQLRIDSKNQDALNKNVVKTAVTFFDAIEIPDIQLRYVKDSLGIEFDTKKELISKLTQLSELNNSLQIVMRVFASIITRTKLELRDDQIQSIFNSSRPLKLFADRYLYELEE